jgi:hypothetical protein
MDFAARPILHLRPIYNTSCTTVNSLLTHTSPWTLQAMGYEGVWGLRMVLKIDPRILLKF